jgi:hypothetical protein
MPSAIAAGEDFDAVVRAVDLHRGGAQVDGLGGARYEARVEDDGRDLEPGVTMAAADGYA